MTADANKALVTRYMEALHRDKSTETLAGVAADEELKHHIALYEASFPGYWIEPEDLITEGDPVVLRGMARGVHRGALMDIAPTGREVAVPIFIAYRIAGGKIVEHWMLVDMPELMRQLGAAAGTAAAA